MSSVTAVEFYWRAGCGFCARLEQGLNARSIPLDKRDIWADRDHAATVRRIANGNEVVPTVVIGDVELVNPSVDEVIAALDDQAPHLLT